MTLASPSQLVRTQAGLARLAGVSTVTVHKALTNQSGVSSEMRRQIHDLAIEHGYRLNVSARAVRTGRFGSVALLLSTAPGRSTVPQGLLAGIQSAVDQRDLQLLLAALPDEKLTSEGFIPKILREWSADGMLINYTDHIPPDMMRLIGEHHVPSIWINTKLEGDCVYPDEWDASWQATRMLLDRGHRRIAYLDFAHDLARGQEAHFSAHARRHGYESAIRDASLAPIVRQEAVQAEDRLDTAMHLLKTPDRPTAAITYAGPEANALFVAAMKLGMTVPGDLSLITHGGARVGDVGVPLATMIIPEREMGRTAVHLLEEKIDQPERVLPPVKIKFTFEDGQTLSACGASPR